MKILIPFLSLLMFVISQNISYSSDTASGYNIVEE